MTRLTVTRQIDAPLLAAWSARDDFGPLGRLVAPMMTAQFRRPLLDGNKAFVERGVVVPRAA